MTLATASAARHAYQEAFGVAALDPLVQSGAEYTMWANVRSMENVYLQMSEGVVDESVLASYGWADNTTFRSGAFLDWWRNRRQRFHPDFVAAFAREYGLGR